MLFCQNLATAEMLVANFLCALNPPVVVCSNAQFRILANVQYSDMLSFYSGFNLLCSRNAKAKQL